MRSLSKLLMVTAAMLLVSGLALAGELHSTSKIVPQKEAYTGPMDRSLLDCSGAIEVDFGVGTYHGDSTGAPNNVTTYSCSSWAETGGEVVYHCVMPDGVTWEVYLSDMSCDLDLAVLDQCDEDLGCLIVVDNGVYVSEPVPGDIYFVVDGYAGAACPFTLTITCLMCDVSSACDQILDVADGTFFTGDTCDGLNNISNEDCSDYIEAGLEDWYEIEMQPGASFTASVAFDNEDGALWVVDHCWAWYCLAYADDTLSGDTEVVGYTNATGMFQKVYLVVDSYGADSCGTYEFSFTPTGGAVAAEAASMGDIKAMFR